MRPCQRADGPLVFLSATPANVRQGSGTYVGIAALRRALVELGHEVALVAPRSGAGVWRRLWFNLRLRHGSFPPGTLIGFDLDGALLPARRAPRVAAIKGVLAEESRFERGLPWLSLRLQALGEARQTRRAERVIATSQYAAAAIARHYGVDPGRIRVVPELLDLAAWRAMLAAAPPRRQGAGRVVLCVAHLYPRKDVATLIRALALLPGVELRVVGTGPESSRLRRLARRLGVRHRAVFTGHVSRMRLAAEYRGADLFCFPSRQEGFGIVLLEAMAAGLPVVAARAAAIPEVVAAPGCGRLFPPGDVAALAAALRDLLADDAARQRLGEAGRRRAELFDAPRVAEQFLAALV